MTYLLSLTFRELFGLVAITYLLVGGRFADGEDLSLSADSPRSKEYYSIFNPTPDEQLRALATDRPDKTESAYSLDAGRVMHETDLVNATVNQDGGIRQETLFLFAPNVKVGLTNVTDIQFIYQPYRYERQRIVATHETHRKVGGGDLVVRLKTNIWGNDGGGTAGAVMPYLSAPVGGGSPGNNGGIQGGLILPFAIDITEEWGLGLMTQVDILRREENGDYYAQWVNTASISHPLFGSVAGYAELFVATSHLQNPIITADSGLTWQLGSYTQLDCGINVGVTEEADDLNPFVGLSQRF